MLSLLKTLAFMLGHLPAAFARACGGGLGTVAYRLFKRHRKTALENLERAFGKTKTLAERERIARTTFRNLGIMFFEFTRIPWMSGKTIGKLVDFKGLEKIDRALEKGRGVLLITAHYGNWELLHAALGYKGYKLELVVRKSDSPVMEEAIRWIRTSPGTSIVYKIKAMLPLVRRLNANAAAMILIDQNTIESDGFFVDFFGFPACTNKGPALLAQKTLAPVLPVFIARNGSRHTVEVWDEIALANTGDKETDAEENTAAFTRAIEEAIRMRPDHWFWVHRRWKTRPTIVTEERKQKMAARNSAH